MQSPRMQIALAEPPKGASVSPSLKAFSDTSGKWLKRATVSLTGVVLYHSNLLIRIRSKVGTPLEGNTFATPSSSGDSNTDLPSTSCLRAASKLVPPGREMKLSGPREQSGLTVATPPDTLASVTIVANIVGTVPRNVSSDTIADVRLCCPETSTVVEPGFVCAAVTDTRRQKADARILFVNTTWSFQSY